MNTHSDNEKILAEALRLAEVLDKIDEALAVAMKQHQAGNLEGAETIYRKVLQVDPHNAEALHLLGLITFQRGSLSRAAKRIRQAIAIDGERGPFHNSLGNVALKMNKYDEAETHFRRAVELEPGNSEFHASLGAFLAGQNRTDEALAAYRQALDVNPGHESTTLILGNYLVHLERFGEAADVFRRGVEHHPENSIFSNDLAGCLWNLGQHGEAVDVYRKLVKADPANIDGLRNLATALRMMEQTEEAEAICRRAVKLAPGDPLTQDCLGNILVDLGHVEEGLAAYGAALDLVPGNADIHSHRALARLLSGDLKGGFEEYEWRWKVSSFPASIRNIPRPVWDGSPLDGQTILLHGEQGAGDTFHFARYAPMVAERGGRVLVGCQPGPRRVLQSLAGVDRVATEGDAVSFDCHAPLMSLPHIFGTTRETIPADVPYLFAEEELSAAWEKRLEAFEGLKVGVAWRGGPSHAQDRKRSLPDEVLAPLGDIPGVDVFSLQKLPSGTVFQVPAGFTDLAPELNDFADTAAAMDRLDLIVSVDTSVAHLAGAMARPIWIMLPKVPEWRWFMEGEGSPWYPQARLFRQGEAGDWKGVVKRVADALKSMAGAS